MTDPAVARHGSRFPAIRAVLVILALLASLTPFVAAAGPDDDVKALAVDLLAQTDGAARDHWLEQHHEQLAAALGRELVTQGLALQKAGRYPPALDAFALAVRLGEITDDLQSRVTGLHGQAEVTRLQGRAEDALPFLERGLREAEAGGDQATVARLSGTMGNVKIQLGEPAAGLDLFQQQRATFEALGDARGRGQAESNIGVALGTMGRNEEAAEAFQRSRELMEAAGYAPGVARAYNNAGLAQRNLGNYGGALEALAHSLALKEAAGNRPELTTTLKNIGNVYQFQGALPQALEYFRRSEAIATELGQKEALAEVLHDEGRTLLEMERPKEAQAALERGLAVANEIKSAQAVNWLSAALAEVYESQGNRPRALELLEGSLATAERAGEMPLVIHSQWQIASLRLAAGKAQDALELAERAVGLAQRYELPDETWPALVVAGRAEVALAHADRAEAALRQAVDVVEALRAHAVGPEADRAVFLVSRAAPYQELVALLADRGRPWEALAAAERSKARVLLDVLAGPRTAIGPALTKSERADERRLEAQVESANSRLRALLEQSKPPDDRLTRLRAEQADGRRVLEDFRTRQYAAHPELRVQRGESPPLAKDDVKALLLGGRTVLLEYALAGKRGYLFALSAGAGGEPTLSVHPLDLPSAALVPLAGRLREQLAARDLEFDATAARLDQALLAPARDVLRHARHVVIVPDGRLWELPFQALRPAGGRYLIEDAAVSYAPSLSVLRDMRLHRRPPASGGRTLLALGNPDLGPAASRRTTMALMSEPLQPLPEAEAQVHAIAQLYDARSSAVRVGAEARESWLKAEVSRYRVLHLATHGLLDDASPLYSELVLAAPREGEKDDGVLEAREILDMNLEADLTVLSACETGRGQSGAGEGLIGMTWAFFVAGCPAMVASQWKVEAGSTSRLMVELHRGLRAGRTPAGALRLAALTQLARKDQRHPFYWAGFVAMGDADRR